MSQLKRKFIEDDAVNGAKIRLDNNEVLKSRNAANSANIGILKVNGSDELIVLTQPKADDALPLPSQLKDYVTVEYIENFLSGKNDPKEAVSVLFDSNVTLTGTHPLNDGDVDVEDGWEIALIGQNDATENGKYTYEVDSGNYTLTRAPDFDTDAKVTKGAYFPVVNGIYAGYQVILTTENPIVLDTTELTFVAYPTTLELIGGDGISKTGNVFDIDLAPNSGLMSTNPGNVAGQLKVKTDTAALEKDQSTKIDLDTGAVVSRTVKKFTKTLDSTDITNQYIDLPDVAGQGSVVFGVQGAGAQMEVTDYTVNYTGGSSSKTRITFAGGLATGGVSALVAGDVVFAVYDTF